MNRCIMVLVPVVLVLTGCLQTRADLRGEGDKPLQEQTRVYQAQNERASTPASPGAPAPPKPLPVPSRLDEVDEQIRQMSGRIDVIENQMVQLNAAATADKDGLAKGSKAVDDKLLLFEEALKKLEAQIANSAKAPAKVEAKVDAKVDANVHAEGQAMFAAKKWKDAIVLFSKYRDRFPKGKNYADSTYKIGVSFQELGMKEEGRPFLEEVVAKFPGSAEAKKASFRLKSTK